VRKRLCCQRSEPSVSSSVGVDAAAEPVQAQREPERGAHLFHWSPVMMVTAVLDSRNSMNGAVVPRPRELRPAPSQHAAAQRMGTATMFSYTWSVTRRRCCATGASCRDTTVHARHALPPPQRTAATAAVTRTHMTDRARRCRMRGASTQRARGGSGGPALTCRAAPGAAARTQCPSPPSSWCRRGRS
jgi:hypothetical protein